MLVRLVRPGAFAIACIAATACASTPVGSFGGAGTSLQTPSLRSLASSSQTVIVSDQSQNDVVICAPGTSPCSSCKTLGSGLSQPIGVSASNSGPPAASTLGYVADSGNQRVVVFTPTCSTVRILSDTGYTPSDVAVATDGTVAVTNLCGESSCKGPGNIAFYTPGSTKISRIVKGPLSQYDFGAFDSKGDFYNDGYAGSTVEVGIVTRNSKIDKELGISGITSPGGIEIAKDGTINIVDQACPCIQIYKSSKHVGTVALAGVVTPVSFAFDKKNKHVWVTDASSKTVDEFAYPAGGPMITQYTGFYAPIGVGVVPPAKP